MKVGELRQARNFLAKVETTVDENGNIVVIMPPIDVTSDGQFLAAVYVKYLDSGECENVSFREWFLAKKAEFDAMNPEDE